MLMTLNIVYVSICLKLQIEIKQVEFDVWLDLSKSFIANVLCLKRKFEVT
jgi:hypothetical protein